MSSRRTSTRREAKGRQLGSADVRRTAAVAMRAAGSSNREIAAAVRVHEWTVSNWFSENEVQESLASLQATALSDARAALAENAEKAVHVLVAALGSKDDSVRLRAATTLLDRIGLPAARPAEAASVNVRELSNAELEQELPEALMRLLSVEPAAFASLGFRGSAPTNDDK